MTLKNIDPKKIATIAVVSAEVLRANPGGYIDEIRPQIAEAFALAFDAAALHGTSTPFSTNLDTGSSTKEFSGVMSRDTVDRCLGTSLHFWWLSGVGGMVIVAVPDR